MQCPASASRRPEKVRKRSAKVRKRPRKTFAVTLAVVFCVAASRMASAEPDAFISQREVTNADVFQQKQRQQQDAYNGQSLPH